MTLKERLYRFRSFWMFPLIAAALLYVTSRREPQHHPGELIWLFPIGVMIWTLLEYGLHRFVFHIQMPLRNPQLRDIVNASHIEHHVSPRNPDKLLVRPPYGLVISAVLYLSIYTFARSGFSTAGIMAGIWTGFLYYEAVHYRVHFSLSATGLVTWQRRAHFYHHFTNNKRCFGVTTPIWDYVFGTRMPRRSPLTSSGRTSS